MNKIPHHGPADTVSITMASLSFIPPTAVFPLKHSAFVGQSLFPRHRRSRDERNHSQVIGAPHISLSISPCTDDQAILSIDVGTSGTKAAIYRPSQASPLTKVHRISYKTRTAKPLHVTQQPSDWFHAAIEASKAALQDIPPSQSICGVTVTGQMQDLIAVGPDPPQLLSSSAILYSDARAHVPAARLSSSLSLSIPPTDILPKLTLLPPPSTPSYSLLLGAADYLLYSFSVPPKPTVTDPTTASTTGLTLSPHRIYNETLLKAAGLEGFLELLPRILERPQVVGHLSGEVARMMGRQGMEGVALIHAGGDAYSTTVGAGCDEKESGTYVYCGTSGWIGGTRRVGTEVRNGLFALGHMENEGLEIVLGSMGSAGGNWTFVAGEMMSVEVEEMCKMAEGVQVGAGGVMWVPYLGGRRCPMPDGMAKGGMIGLGSGCGRKEIARAVVEGVVFGFGEAGDVVGGLEKGLRVVGGGNKCKEFIRGIAGVIGEGNVEVGCGEGVGVLGGGIVGSRVLGIKGKEYGRGERVSIGKQETEEWKRAFGMWREAWRRIDGLNGV